MEAGGGRAYRELAGVVLVVHHLEAGFEKNVAAVR
jgi:hypothetical protein